MKIQEASIYILELRLKKKFRHGSYERNSNKTAFLELSNGTFKGYGEALPRDYVTGENIETVIECVKRYISEIPQEIESIAQINDFLYDCEPEGSKNMASLCCLDLALLDIYSKSKQKNVSDTIEEELGYLREDKKIKVTSYPMDLDSKIWKKTLGIIAGLPDVKLKIDPDTSAQRINQIGSGLIRPRSLRLDGNCSLEPKGLEEILKKVKVPINSIEQPFKPGVEAEIKGYKIMADESLVSLEDAKKIEFDYANIRIGKNGGILRSLDIIGRWTDRGKGYMLGSLVGETSILSSALLHIANLTNPLLIEGCYSSRALEIDPVKKPIKIKAGGNIGFNYSKPGLGMELDLQNCKYIKIKLI
jgi:L-Ala-D/L-Glu epimerase